MQKSKNLPVDYTPQFYNDYHSCCVYITAVELRVMFEAQNESQRRAWLAHHEKLAQAGDCYYIPANSHHDVYLGISLGNEPSNYASL